MASAVQVCAGLARTSQLFHLLRSLNYTYQVFNLTYHCCSMVTVMVMVTVTVTLTYSCSSLSCRPTLKMRISLDLQLDAKGVVP